MRTLDPKTGSGLRASSHLRARTSIRSLPGELIPFADERTSARQAAYKFVRALAGDFQRDMAAECACSFST